MNTMQDPLNPSVAAALTSWLALVAADRIMLARAIAALDGLGTGQGTETHTASHDRTPDQPRSLTIDAVGEVDTHLFRSKSYRALGAGHTISVYCAGSRGLLELAQRIGGSHYKIGWSRGPTPETRLAHLRATAYGACWQDGGSVTQDCGWDNWEPTVLPGSERAEGSPVRCQGRYFAVDLPGGVDPGEFDSTLMQALAPRSLADFSESNAGRAQCRAQGVDPARLARLTEQSTKRGVRYKAARELFRFSPRQEAEALARLIEAVVAQAVAPLLGPTRASSPRHRGVSL